MVNFFEIDFLNNGTDGVGEAICIRYGNDQESKIHLIDGGYTDTGEIIIDHIRNVYQSNKIDNVIVTHNDRDHTLGLESVIQSNKIRVGKLWMNLPWNYTTDLLRYFSGCQDVGKLSTILKDEFGNLATLETKANSKGIKIKKALQNKKIGKFRVLSPSKNNFLSYIAVSNKTLKPSSLVTANYKFYEDNILGENIFGEKPSEDSVLGRVLEVEGKWGDEEFPPQGTKPVNEMSIVQIATLCGKNILLTGDVGRNGLLDSIQFAEFKYDGIPVIDLFQVPHHGSSGNVSSYDLDKWLGDKIDERERNNVKFCAVICATKSSRYHPSNAVVRAMIHRGGKVYSTEDGALNYSVKVPRNYPYAEPLEYPEFQKKYI